MFVFTASEPVGTGADTGAVAAAGPVATHAQQQPALTGLTTATCMPEAAEMCCVSADRKSVLMLRRGKTAPWRPSTWSFPGGYIDTGETALAAAVRELLEETGLSTPTLIEPLGGPFRRSPPGDDVCQAFVCECEDMSRLGSSSSFPGGLPIDDKLGFPENDEWRWVTEADAKSIEHCTKENLVLIQHVLAPLSPFGAPPNPFGAPAAAANPCCAPAAFGAPAFGAPPNPFSAPDPSNLLAATSFGAATNELNAPVHPLGALKDGGDPI
jgi:8-oxo-dGTP pyrophosphatase MutT (NUDIX family)